VTMPLMPPRKKNPVLRTRQMNLPPWARGRTALGMTAAAAEGRFELQVCQRCRAVQYPPRDACHRCLSAELQWTAQDGAGELLSATVLHHSNDPFYRERLPWRLGLVRLDAGPTVIVHLHGDVAAPYSHEAVRVRVGARLDRAGAAVLIGFPPEETANMADDKMLREMTVTRAFERSWSPTARPRSARPSSRRWSRPAPRSSGSATPSRGRSCPASTTSRRSRR
jgi:uncharacterized OB-fold protein